jgi:hypothetical protein
MKPVVLLLFALAFAAGAARAQNVAAPSAAPPGAGPAGAMPAPPPADMHQMDMPQAGTHQMDMHRMDMHQMGAHQMDMHRMDMHQMTGMHASKGMAGMPQGAEPSAAQPTESGQAAFGAIQEIVRMLQADPATDWSRVDIDALRQHLIDMDEVTLHADARKTPIDDGVRIAVTGTGRTLAAIRRMIPAHAQDIDGRYGWSVQAKPIPDGEEMTVTGPTPADAQKIRALGFMGIMVLGTHQMHHLAMAKGEMMHMP